MTKHDPDTEYLALYVAARVTAAWLCGYKAISIHRHQDWPDHVRGNEKLEVYLASLARTDLTLKPSNAKGFADKAAIKVARSEALHKSFVILMADAVLESDKYTKGLTMALSITLMKDEKLSWSILREVTRSDADAHRAAQAIFWIAAEAACGGAIMRCIRSLGEWVLEAGEVSHLDLTAHLFREVGAYRKDGGEPLLNWPSRSEYVSSHPYWSDMLQHWSLYVPR